MEYFTCELETFRPQVRKWGICNAKKMNKKKTEKITSNKKDNDKLLQWMTERKSQRHI